VQKQNLSFFETNYTSVNEVLDATRMQADALNKAKATINAKTFVIVEGKGNLNSTVVAKLHEINGNFVKDETNLDSSLAHVSRTIVPDINKTIITSTTPLNDSDHGEIQKFCQDFTSAGIKQNNGLTSYQFEDILTDEDSTQIVLLARVNKNGIVFSNRTVSFYKLSEWLYECPPKDFIYIISNESERLQTLFAESGKFTFVISSSFKERDEAGLIQSLGQLREFYGFAFLKVPIKTSVINEAIQSDMNFSRLLEKKNIVVDPNAKTMEFPVGKIPPEALGSLPPKISKTIRKKLPGYEQKSVRNIIDEIQIKRTRELRKEEMNINRKLRAIPDLKVENSSIWSTDKC
jgi:hypothetical protein